MNGLGSEVLLLKPHFKYLNFFIKKRGKVNTDWLET